MKINSVLRLDDIIENKDKEIAADSEYYLVYVISSITGTTTPCMFTREAVKVGIDRAGKNITDIVPLSFWQKMYHSMLNKVK